MKLFDHVILMKLNSTIMEYQKIINLLDNTANQPGLI